MFYGIKASALAMNTICSVSNSKLKKKQTNKKQIDCIVTEEPKFY